MIMSVEEFRRYVTTNESDEVLSVKLSALELLIRKHTNNNFQRRAYRKTADIQGGLFVADSAPFKAGDTVQISESPLNEGLCTVKEVGEHYFEVNEDVVDEFNVLVTKVEYPIDVKMGVVNMLKWDLENRDKVGIASETISRHSVTYFNMDGNNSMLGYPKSLCGFLTPYKKARF